MTDIAPGIHRGLSFEDYCGIDAVNNSALTEIITRSPAHYRAYRDGERKYESDAMARGTALHAALLEPDRFEAEYAIGPDVDLRTKAGKEEWAACVADHPGKTLIRGADAPNILGMRRSLWTHPTSSSVLRTCGRDTELVCVWLDDRTGLRCKARIDAYSAALGMVVDLKSMRDARPEELSRSVANYGYHRQAAFYVRGAKACGLECDAMTFLAVEPDPPYEPTCFTLGPDSLRLAEAEIDRALLRVAWCIEHDAWPGYASEVVTVELPDWYFKREERVGNV